MAKIKKYKVEIYHPNSMRVMSREFFIDLIKAKKAYNEAVNSDWDVVTLFIKKGSEWETLEYNS